MGPSELPDESRETWGTASASAEVSMADILVAAAGVYASRGVLELRRQRLCLRAVVYLRERAATALANISRARRFTA